MKTWKKIVRLLVLFAILVPTLALIAIQVPAVQTALVGRVTEYLTRGLDGDVHIGKVYFSFPNNLILKDIVISSDDDTLLCAKKMLVRAKTTSLAFSDEAVIRRVSLEDGFAAIRRLDDSTTTLSAMLAPLMVQKNDTTALPWSSIRLDKLTVKNFGFAFDNRLPADRDTAVAPHVDWKNLRLEDINLSARNIHYTAEALDLRVDRVSFREQGGLDLQNLESDIRLDGEGLTFDGLEYDDTWSQLHADRFRLGFNDFTDFNDLLEKVSVDLSVLESRLDMRTLYYYTGAEALAKADLGLLLDGTVSGPFSDLRTDLLRIQSPSKDTRLTFKGRVQGISNINTARIDLQIFDGITRTADIASMLDQMGMGINTRSIRKIAPGEPISLKGSINGRLSGLKADLDVKTASMGSAQVDAHLAKNGKHMQVEGSATSQNLDLGRLLSQPSLGTLTADATLAFDNTGGKTRINLTPARIDHFTFRGYDYHGIVAEAKMVGDNITADIHSTDPNLQMNLHGDIDVNNRTKERRYRIGMDLDTVDLSALNFDKREGVTASMSLDADITQTARGDLLGEATIRSLRGQVQDKTFDVGDIFLNSTLDQDRYELTLNSSVAKVDYDGNVFLTHFIRQAVQVVSDGHLNSIIKQKGQHEYDPEAFGSLMLRTLDLQPVCSFFAPKLYISRESSVGVSMLGNSVEGRIATELVAAGSLFVHNLQGRVYNDGLLLRGMFNVDRVESGELFADNISLDAAADSTGLDLRARFENEDEKKNRADIQTRLSFGDPATDGWKFKADIRPSDLTLAGSTWNLDPSTVFYRDKHIRIEEFALNHGNQSLEIDGIAGDQPGDTLMVWLNDFDVNLVNAFLQRDLDLQGKLTGEGQGIALLGKDRALLLDLYGKELSMIGEPIGDLRVRSNWDEGEKAFKFLVNNTLEGRHPVRATASYRPSNKNLDLNLKLDQLSTAYLEPFLGGLASDIGGAMSGGLQVKGPLDKLDIKSENTRFNSLKFKLDYTQVEYTAEGPFTVNSQGVTFDNISVKDKFGHPATLTGGIPYDYFKNLRLNVRLDLQNVMALNTRSTDNESFYGRAFADGNIRILGTLDNIRLNLNLTTKENSTIHIPLDNSASEKNSLLTFINNETKPLGLYDSLVIAHNVSRGKDENGHKSSKLNVNLRLNATPDAEVQIEVDRSTGDILKARGNGQMSITAGAGSFGIKGDYRVDSGNYHFGMLGLTTRDFSIDPGGSLAFNGNVMDTDLDLTATYHTKASLSPLIADSTAVSTRRNVECSIAITGKLANPQIGFKINVPDLDPSTASRVESALNTEDKRMKQALALLISGGFVPDEQSGIVNSTTILFSNASEMMAGQINNIFRQLEIPVDLGFNYQPTETGRSIFDVAVSTQLFNNRVSINGNIGNRQYISSSNSDIVGDLDIEIKLNRQGQLRLTLFSHSADQYSNYLDQSQRNGAGIVYQEDFNSLGELWRKVFHIKDNEQKTVPDSDPAGRPRPR
jgi:hypothetical protein